MDSYFRRILVTVYISLYLRIHSLSLISVTWKEGGVCVCLAVQSLF